MKPASATSRKMESPPNSVTATNETTKVVTVPVVPVIPNDEIYYYVFVKASLYSGDCCVFGLSNEEIQALSKKFQSEPKVVENGVMMKTPVTIVINSLAQLGYKVVSSCGETETLWTMQREI